MTASFRRRKTCAGDGGKKKQSNESAAPKTRLDKDRLLLGEDEFVEAGQAQPVSVVAVANMQFTISLEQFSTVYLAVADADLTQSTGYDPAY